MITYPCVYPCIGESSNYQNFDSQCESPFLEVSLRGQVCIAGSYLCVLHEGTQAAFYALMPTIPSFDASKKPVVLLNKAYVLQVQYLLKIFVYIFTENLLSILSAVFYSQPAEKNNSAV